MWHLHVEFADLIRSRSSFDRDLMGWLGEMERDVLKLVSNARRPAQLASYSKGWGNNESSQALRVRHISRNGIELWLCAAL